MSNNKKTGSIPGTSRKRNSTKPARPYGAIGNCKYARRIQPEMKWMLCLVTLGGKI